MKKHFEQELERLYKSITAQATLVETAVRNSILAFSERAEDLALFVIIGDDTLDANEVRIEEECLKVLALHQPVASDLRHIVTLLKVNRELERIGDLAVNISERALHFLKSEARIDTLDFTEMFRLVSALLKNALDSFLFRDTALAEKVIEGDNEIDAAHRENIERIKNRLREGPDGMEPLLDLLTVSRNLERIADGCVNIGEDVIYQEQGRIIRHAREGVRNESPKGGSQK